MIYTLTGNHCTVHQIHSPEPLRTVHHHIWPQEYGGPSVPENMVWVCDTGHYNIHALLAEIQANPKVQIRGHKSEQALARLGYTRIQAQST